MFSNIHVEGFRGISNLDVDGLRQITLLVGKNNTGKTSVLEAILLLCGATNPLTPTLIGQLRGQRIASAGDADIIFRSLFSEMKGQSQIKIVGWWGKDGQKRLIIEPLAATKYAQNLNSEPPSAIETDGASRIGGVRLRFMPSVASDSIIVEAAYNPHTQQVEASPIRRDHLISGTLLSSRSFFNLTQDTEKYSSLKRIKREKQVIEAIQLVDSRIQDLVVISEESGATVYADIGGESLIPLAVCGEGILRLFSIVLAISSTKSGVVLVDEIDNGLHYTVMNKLWTLLQKMCSDQQVQLIATTHNEEMLHEAMKAFQNQPESFAVFRLDRVEAGMKATHYEGEVLDAVGEMGWEIRG